jgi:hypothetical protein
MTQGHNRPGKRITASRTARVLSIGLALGLTAVAGAVSAAEPPTYEPSYRYRLRNEMCKKDEAQFGARCAQQCTPGYRMEQQAATPVCRRKN